MDLAELSHDECVALVALIETVVASDGAVSDDEATHVARIAAAFGEEKYHALVDETDERFADEAALKTFLSGVIRPEARELIYGTVLDAALPDVIDRHESSLLGWLATEWGITVQFES
ncbi:MAG: hypothetical protein IT293_06740 [Deltaproteobacteria bacterium]|nr:hypothetical protein [Deltaproteobacteria bacterium]